MMKSLFCYSKKQAWEKLHEKYVQAPKSDRYGATKDMGGDMFAALRELEGYQIGDCFGNLIIFDMVRDPADKRRGILLMRPL